MWLEEELERKFSSHWWKTDCTKYVQNKTKQEQVAVLCCSDLISNPERKHDCILSYTLIHLNMLFNFLSFPINFWNLAPFDWKFILQYLGGVRGGGWGSAIFRVRHSLTWKKVTDSGYQYSKPRGLHDWNILPTKSSSYWKNNQTSDCKECTSSPKKKLFSHYFEYLSLKPALRGGVFTWNICQLGAHLLKG